MIEAETLPTAAAAAATAAATTSEIASAHTGGATPGVRLIASLGELEAERTAAVGALAAWEELTQADAAANFFQSPAWCMDWYRCYADQFSPLVVVVTRGERLVGLVPLAVETATKRLVFAGDNMADYRDVAAAEGHREEVVRELLRVYREGGFQEGFRVGPTQPESETTRIILSLAEQSAVGVRGILREHPCWRWWPRDAEALKSGVKKKDVRKDLNHFNRQGAVLLRHVTTREAWDEIKQEFYDFHSLRQLQIARGVSFHDPRKRALFDSLFAHRPLAARVSALQVGERVIAGHFWYVWRDVLHWGASSIDIREENRSPGQVLLALLYQDAENASIRGVDLTLGTGDVKRRFGNECVNLPSVDLYASERNYRARTFRDAAVTRAKQLLTRTGKAYNWHKTARLASDLKDAAGRARGLGLGGGLKLTARVGAKRIGERTRGLILSVTPPEAASVEPRLKAGETCEFRRDEIRDLAKWEGAARETARALALMLQSAPDALRRGRTLHTVLVNGQLAGWGWSYWPTEPALVTETETTLEFEPKSVSLYDYFVLPEFRGRRLYQALLAQILRERFAEGAERAYIGVLAANTASLKAIERVGFRVIAVDELQRFLRWKRASRREVGKGDGNTSS